MKEKLSARIKKVLAPKPIGVTNHEVNKWTGKPKGEFVLGPKAFKNTNTPTPVNRNGFGKKNR